MMKKKKKKKMMMMMMLQWFVRNLVDHFNLQQCVDLDLLQGLIKGFRTFPQCVWVKDCLGERPKVLGVWCRSKPVK